MKKLLLALALALGLLTLGTTRAATANHYSVAFNAAIFSSVQSGPNSASLKVTKVNNATILNQLVASGSFGNLKASDMDIVLNLGTEIIDVIDKTSHTVLFPLVVSGTDENFNADVIYGSSVKESVLSDSSLEINLPDGTTWNANSLVHGVIKPTTPPTVLSISLSFLGGLNDMIIQGSVRKKAKVYVY